MFFIGTRTEARFDCSIRGQVYVVRVHVSVCMSMDPCPCVRGSLPCFDAPLRPRVAILLCSLRSVPQHQEQTRSLRRRLESKPKATWRRPTVDPPSCPPRPVPRARGPVFPTVPMPLPLFCIPHRTSRNPCAEPSICSLLRTSASFHFHLYCRISCLHQTFPPDRKIRRRYRGSKRCK